MRITNAERARQAGMSLECWKLQTKLQLLPLVPLNGSLRRRRDKLVAKLLEQARTDGCVAAVDLVAGTI